MKKTAAFILIICMAVTGSLMAIPQRIVTGEDMTVSAASYPALKEISYKATGNQRKDVVGFAKSQLGYAEGRNNNTYFGNWFGCNYNPWCAMFVCWAEAKAGVPKSVVPRLATADRSWAKEQGVYYKSKYWGGSYTPRKGDLIYFSWSVRDYADHIGMVTGTHKEDGTTYVDTIEGNKHDKVTTGTYALNNRYVLGYASPKYKVGDAPEEDADTYTLKYRDGLKATAEEEETAIIKPVTGTIGKELKLTDKKFKREGYTYDRWKVYRLKNNKNLYLCRDTKGKKDDEWHTKGKIPEGFEQVFVDCGGKLKLRKKVTFDVCVSPVWEVKKYKITYDANGGMDTPEAQEKVYGKDLTLTTRQPTREGTNFLGWATSADAEKAKYQGGETYTRNEDLKLYAVWGIEPYKVKVTKKISSRDGPGKDHDKVKTIEAGGKYTISKEKNGWGQLPDGSWIDLTYTIKQDVTTYQLNYVDGDDATTEDSSVIPPVSVKYGSPVQTSQDKFDKKGHHYSRWQLYSMRNGKKVYLYTNKDTGSEKWCVETNVPEGFKVVRVKQGEDVTVNGCVGEQIYITPIWKIDTYKISYSANGGKNAPKAQTKTYNKKLTLTKKKPTRKWAKFLGWSTKSNATKAKYKAGGKFTKNKDVKLYAVWKVTWFKVKTTDEVNKRTGPGTNYKVVGVIDKGKTVKIIKEKNGWGKLTSGRWISLSLTSRIGSDGKAIKKSSSKDSSDKKSEAKEKDKDKKDKDKKDKDKKDKDKKDSDKKDKDKSDSGKSVKKSSDKKKGSSKDEESDQDADADDEDLAEDSDDESGSDDDDDGDTAKVTKPFAAQVTADEGVNARSGPGKSYDVVSTCDKGEYVALTEVSKGWGKLEGSDRWILMENTKITGGYTVRISDEDLTQRSGPGSDYESKGTFEPGKYEIVKIKDEWGKVKSTGTWVKLTNTKRVSTDD